MSPAPEFHPRDFRRGLRHAGLTPGEYRVAVEMCEYATIDQPEVWPSVAALADSCHMTARAVVRIARRLEEKQLIVRTATSKGGRAKTNHWRLHVRAPETLTDGSGFTGAETLTESDRNPDPTGTETLTRGSGEVVKEVVRSRGASPQPGTSPDEPQQLKDLLPQKIGNSNSNSNSKKRPEKNTRTPAGQSRPRCPDHAHIADDTDVPNCHACMNLRLAAENLAAAETAAAEQRRAAEAQARRAAIDACPRCDEKGWVDVDDDGTIVRHCDHKAVAS